MYVSVVRYIRTRDERRNVFHGIFQPFQRNGTHLECRLLIKRNVLPGCICLAAMTNEPGQPMLRKQIELACIFRTKSMRSRVKSSQENSSVEA